MTTSPKNKIQKKTYKRRHRGSAALFETSAAAMVMSAYLIMITNAITGYTRTTDMRHSADEAYDIAKTTAAWIQENAAASLAAIDASSSSIAKEPTSRCVEGRDGTNHWSFFRLSNMPRNTGGSTDTSACVSLIALNLIPQTNTSTTDIYNRFGQTYWVAMRPIGITQEISGQSQSYNQIEAVLFTRDGPKLSDEDIREMSSRLGPPGGGIYTKPPQGYGTNQIVLFGNATYGIQSTVFTPGHIGISLNYMMDPQIDDYIHRTSQPGTNAPTHMDAKLYVDSAEPGNPSNPVNINLNGSPSVFSPATVISQSQNNYAGTTTSPHNSIYGLRQTDTQILTAGTSTADPFNTVQDQTNYERKEGKTVNNAASISNTLLSNANFNITEGYRLAVADGLHVTASVTTISKDANHTTDEGANSHQSAAYKTGQSIPGLTWDNAPNPSGSTSHVGIMAFLSQDPTGGADQNNIGTDISPAQAVISTYNRVDDPGAPIGFEADGGFRAPVYYDSKNMAYLVDPSGTSHMNELILDATSRSRPGHAVTGSIYTSGYRNDPWPDELTWQGQGIYTYDMYSNGGTISSGNVVNGANHVNAYISRDGILNATGHTDSGYITILSVVNEGDLCEGQTMPLSDNGAGNEATRTIPVGAIGRDSTGRPLACSGQTGRWEEIKSTLFQNMTYLQYPIQQWIYNSNSLPMYITTDCTPTPGNVSRFNSQITATVNDAHGNTSTVHSTQETGGHDNNFIGAAHIAFMVPPGGSFWLDEYYGSSTVEQNFCRETMYQ